MQNECKFTNGICDGGMIHADGIVGCIYKVNEKGECNSGGMCEWLAELPNGTMPRDFYNERTMEALR